MTGTSGKKAVILHSGGLDSTTTVAIAVKEGFEPCAMSFFYGQRHDREIETARRYCQARGIGTRIEIEIDMRKIGGSALTADIEVPKDRSGESMGDSIPVTYVPARNTIFLSYALGWAEVLGAYDIFIGVNAVDYSGYPDCRPEFIASFEQTANLATRAGVENHPFKIHTPLIDLTKAAIIRLGNDLGVDYSQTWSCYDPSPAGLSCGHCDSCRLRLKGFSDAGLADPLKYA